MICETTHRILHRARSLRRLRPADDSDAPASPTYHKRQISTSSSTSSSTTSSSRRDGSLDYDPLRLHPSMEIERGPHVPPQTFYEHEADEIISFYHHSRDVSREEQFPSRSASRPVDMLPRRPSRHSEHEIHGGFDFGFTGQASSPGAESFASSVSSTGSMESVSARPLRAARSVVELRRRDEAWADAVYAVPASPRRRLPPAGGNDFIKRGGWKRRGIVFGGGEERVMDEDDAFEI